MMQRTLNYDDVDDIWLLADSAVNKEKHLDHLKLALAWNRLDFAEKILMSNDGVWKVCFSVDFCISAYYFCALTLYSMKNFVITARYLFCDAGVK